MMMMRRNHSSSKSNSKQQQKQQNLTGTSNNEPTTTTATTTMKGIFPTIMTSPLSKRNPSHTSNKGKNNSNSNSQLSLDGSNYSSCTSTSTGSIVTGYRNYHPSNRNSSNNNNNNSNSRQQHYHRSNGYNQYNGTNSENTNTCTDDWVSDVNSCFDESLATTTCTQYYTNNNNNNNGYASINRNSVTNRHSSLLTNTNIKSDDDNDMMMLSQSAHVTTGDAATVDAAVVAATTATRHHQQQQQQHRSHHDDTEQGFLQGKGQEVQTTRGDAEAQCISLAEDMKHYNNYHNKQRNSHHRLQDQIERLNQYYRHSPPQQQQQHRNNHHHHDHNRSSMMNQYHQGVRTKHHSLFVHSKSSHHKHQCYVCNPFDHGEHNMCSHGDDSDETSDEDVVDDAVNSVDDKDDDDENNNNLHKSFIIVKRKISQSDATKNNSTKDTGALNAAVVTRSNDDTVCGATSDSLSSDTSHGTVRRVQSHMHHHRHSQSCVDAAICRRRALQRRRISRDVRSKNSRRPSSATSCASDIFQSDDEDEQDELNEILLDPTRLEESEWNDNDYSCSVHYSDDEEDEGVESSGAHDHYNSQGHICYSLRKASQLLFGSVSAGQYAYGQMETHDMARTILESLVQYSSDQVIVFHALELLCIMYTQQYRYDLTASYATMAITGVDVDYSEKQKLFNNIAVALFPFGVIYNQFIYGVYTYLLNEIQMILESPVIKHDYRMLVINELSYFFSSVQILLVHCLMKTRDEDLMSLIGYHANKYQLIDNMHYIHLCYLTYMPNSSNVMVNQFDILSKQVDWPQRCEYAKVIVYYMAKTGDWNNLFQFLKKLLIRNSVSFPGAYEAMLCSSLIQGLALDPYLKLVDEPGVQCCKYLHMAHDFGNLQLFDRMLLKSYPFIQLNFPFGHYSFADELENVRQRIVDNMKQNTLDYVLCVRHLANPRISATVDVPSTTDMVCLGTGSTVNSSVFYCKQTHKLHSMQLDDHEGKLSFIKQVERPLDEANTAWKALLCPNSEQELLLFNNNQASLYDIESTQMSPLSVSGDVVLHNGSTVYVIDQSLCRIYQLVNKSFECVFEYSFNHSRLLNFAITKENCIVALSALEPDVFYWIDLESKTQHQVHQQNCIPSKFQRSPTYLLRYLPVSNELLVTFAKESGFIGACSFSFSKAQWSEVLIAGDLVTQFSLIASNLPVPSSPSGAFLLTKCKQLRDVSAGNQVVCLQDGLCRVETASKASYLCDDDDSYRGKMYRHLIQGQWNLDVTKRYFFDTQIIFTQ